LRIGQQAYITHQIYGKEMADGGKLAAPPKKPAPKATEPADDGSKAKKPDTVADVSDSTPSSASDRQAQWEQRRQAKAKTAAAKAASSKTTTTSDRVTPKGTRPRDTSNKRNRKR
jgi:hypothetical protein